MSKWTEKTIKDYCNTILAAHYGGMTLDIPVKINAKVSRTLGMVRYTHYRSTNTDTPTSFEISKQLIETASDDSIIAVVLHELSHYIAMRTTNKAHCHDSYFKAICKKIGCTNDGVSTSVDRTVSQLKIHKYNVYCEHCGYIGGYDRMCKTIKNIDLYRHKCGGNLRYETAK